MPDVRVIEEPSSEDWTLYEAISVLCSVVEKYAVLSGNGGDAEALRMARAVLLRGNDSFLERRIEELTNENNRLRRRLEETGRKSRP